MTYWQIASGDKTRDYSKVFIDYGVVCVGPGNPGLLGKETKPIYEKMGEWNKIKFFLEVKEGDRIVLKNGRSLIQSVGEVIKYDGKIYNYSNCFKDVDGWDLQHFIKVKWKDIRIKFKNSTELHRSTMARLAKKSTISVIENKWKGANYIEDKYLLPKLVDTKEITYRQLEEVLIDNGFRIRDAENTSKTIEQIEKLANWYLKNRISSTEHEIRTFLVVPFLQALGWSPQKIGIEVTINRSKIDIMLFSDNARKKPKILVETKKMWDGSSEAIKQSMNYLNKSSELNNVSKFIVTDGLRYWLYEKNVKKEWGPIAYMNFNYKKEKYSAYPDINGVFGFIKEVIE